MTNIPWGPEHPHYDLTAEEFFNADPSANIAFWSRAPYWTIEEATALSFGFEPRVVNRASISNYEHPFVKNYRERLDLARRAQKVGDLFDVNRPEAYLAWAETVGIEFWAEIVNAIAERGQDIRDIRTDYLNVVNERDDLAVKLAAAEEKLKLDKPPIRSEREAMLTIIAAMAKDGYGYTPGGPVITEIYNEITKIGLTLDVKTVRKHISDAMKLIPPEDTQKA